MSNTNHYEVLGIARNADYENIKEAYKKLVLKNHPDRNPPETREFFEAQFKKINDAYETLKDPVKRKKYDDVLKREQNRPPKPTRAAPSPPKPTRAAPKPPAAQAYALTKENFLKNLTRELANKDHYWNRSSFKLLFFLKPPAEIRTLRNLLATPKDIDTKFNEVKIFLENQRKNKNRAIKDLARDYFDLAKLVEEKQNPSSQFKPKK